MKILQIREICQKFFTLKCWLVHDAHFQNNVWEDHGLSD